jgi:HK97 family phage major capsid protein
MSSIDEGRLRELQGALREKMQHNKEIADSFRVDNGTVVVTTEQKSAFDKNMADIREIKGLIEGLESLKKVQDWGSVASDTSVAAEVAASSVSSAPRAMTVGQAFVESAEFKALNGGRNGANMPSPFQYNGSLTGGYGVKDVYSALPTGTPGSFGTIQRDPMVTQPTRTKRVRDLFPSRSTTAAVIEYFRHLGFTTPGTTASNNAAMVAERSGGTFGAKPQSSFQFVGQQAPVRTLAHWEAAHRNVLADEPQLRSIIDNELMYGLRLQEDFQILRGDGTGENLEGIMETSGIQNYAWSDGPTDVPVADSMADAIRRAATLSFLAYYEPTGVILHPSDWEKIELTKDNNGQYLVAVSVALGGEPRIWRIPVVETPAMQEGKALVGAFGTGAQLYDREQASIRVSEQHSDFFVRNAIVVLAEQRLALAVKRPEAFVLVDFDEAPTLAQ